MTTDIQTRVTESDILAAMDGIVNAHLTEGIQDRNGNVLRVSVVTWRVLGGSHAIPGLTNLAVIIHLDGVSIHPFHGTHLTVALDQLSHAATLVGIRAMELANAELDRREEKAELAAFDNGDQFPLLTEPVLTWAAYVESHPFVLTYAEKPYPAIDGDRVQRNVGPLARTSVVGESTLWEKVSA